MSKKDENSENETTALIRRVNGPTELVQSPGVIARRTFLTTSAIGVTAMVAYPWSNLVAAQTNCQDLLAGFVHKPLKKGFWATLLGILDLGASLFGFGGLIGTVANIVRNVAGNRRQIAEAAIRGALGSLSSRLPFNVLNPPQTPWNPLGFTPLTPQIASDLRFFTQALNRDQYNGATLFFDHTNASRAAEFDPRGILSAPTIHALTINRCVFEALGYRGDAFKNAILAPARQLSSGQAMGGYNKDYGRPDRYETNTGATIDVDYSNASDDNNGGTGEGEITTFKLENRSGSNKRMGLRRFPFSFAYSPDPLVPGNTGFELRYTKGYKQCRL